MGGPRREIMSIAEFKEILGENANSVLTRPEIAKIEESVNKRLPAEFWNTYKIAHGKYCMVNAPVNEVKMVDHVEIVREEPPMKKKEILSREIDVFVRESQVPKINQGYVQYGHYNDVFKLVDSKKFFTLYITGDSGTGKNAMIDQVCAKLDRPVVRVSITHETKEEHIIGTRTLIDGNIVYEDGPLIWAALEGAVLLLDELSLASANEIMCLQAAMEGGSFFVKSLNKVITPKEGFCIIATDNTKGQGSDSAKWIGTNILNAAFLDRFDMMIEQDFPNEKVELEIYRKEYEKYSSNVDEQFISDLCGWVHIIRRTFKQGAIDDLISTRRALRIIKSKALWFSAEKSIDMAICRYDSATSDAFKTLWEKYKSGEFKQAA